jgi:predicted ferric reductase
MDMILWQVIRASGLLAYLLLSVSVALGVSIRTRAMDGLVKRGWVNELHQSLSIASLATTALHVVMLLGNRHVAFGPGEIVIPFVSAWKPVPVAGGILALYLLALLVLSSCARTLIGQRAWRAIHYGGFAAWVLAVSHGVTAGSDWSLPVVQWLYLLSSVTIVFLLMFRVLTIRASKQPVTPSSSRPSPPLPYP